MHLKIHGLHVTPLGIRLVTTAAVVAEVVKIAMCVRKPSRILRLKMLCVVKSDRRLILPASFILSLSEKVGDDQMRAV